MAEETTAEASVAATTAAGAQQREHADPVERSHPIPRLVTGLIVGVLLFGVGYIVTAEPPGAPGLGDRRTLTDLRTGGSDASRTAGVADGKQLFAAHCVACHQASGKGLPGVFPPLDGSEWVLGEERVLANILLHGIQGEISVAGSSYQGAMPAFGQLSDVELAALGSHVRSQWSNRAAPLQPALLAQERKASPRTTPFAGGAELKLLGDRKP